MSIPVKLKNIYITGGAGFIGSHITKQFVKEKKNVTIIDNESLGKKEFLSECLKKRNCTLIKGNLLYPQDIAMSLSPSTDIIFHLACNSDISKGSQDPSLDFQQTIIATFNLLQEMRRKNITRLVFFSSGSGVYGNVKKKFTSESYGPLQPESMYGAAKLSAEALISSFSYLFGIHAWIFRPANIIGGNATHGVIFDFIGKLNNNPHHLTILGDGRQSKSYIYVTDFIHAVFLAIEKANERVNLFNVSTKSFITVNEIAKLVIQAMNLKDVVITHTDGSIGWPGDIPVTRLDTEKLRKLGWKEQYSTKEAVRQTIKDILSQKLL